MKKFFQRLKVIVKEVFNVITNFLVPIISLVIAILEILPIPMKFVKIVKTVEYWLFYAAGTAEDIEKAIDEQIN